MVIDFKDDIVDEDGMLSYYSYNEKMKKFYPLMKEAKDVKAIDNKKYLRLEAIIDEIGRMIGGWIKATK